MKLAVDTSCVIAVLVREPTRSAILTATRGLQLIAPPSLGWEVGNAFSAMFKRQLLDRTQALEALADFPLMTIEEVPIQLANSIELAANLGIYAYDAYMIVCAREYDCPLITLDHGLSAAAKRAGVKLLEFAK
jgi:predicted nucleic acid-binding protein